MAVRDLNKVILIGNVGENPKLTTTSTGNPVCTFFMATNRTWSPADSTESKEETDWHAIVVFSQLAQICSKILQKGTKVFVQGRVQTREFTADNGEKIRKKEVVALDVIGLDKRKEIKK